MGDISSPILTTKLHQPSAAPFRGLLEKLMGRNTSADTTLPRKLASAPCAASLLSGSLPLDEINRRRLQLQRIVDVVMLDATRDEENELVITLKLSLRSEAPREPVGIFVPNNAPVEKNLIKTFHEVKQLGRVLTFCVGKCEEDCEFCCKLRTYLDTHWVRDPLVSVVNMGKTVLRKPSLAMHLARLLAFVTGKYATPGVAAIPKDVRVQLAPQLAPIGVHHKDGAPRSSMSACVVQNSVVAVLFDFFDAFNAD
ncbi:unnamed protein product [Phytophthora fragariaefolia]|uniref:Unnamed protein product n=1 Tax=Phytophthora fragariaefolia TaxID=1490495 RepID=A0A9W7D5W4_9STRA|nr:unnamed protein product [Phytophthora fragariaefolia]